MQDLQPWPELIGRTRDAFLAALRVRYSSPLFRLPTAAAIQQQLRFHNTGKDQVCSGQRKGASPQMHPQLKLAHQLHHSRDSSSLPARRGGCQRHPGDHFGRRAL